MERFIKIMRKEKCAKCNLQNKQQRDGFTLVELIVVLVILAILAALLIPALTGYIDKAKKKQVVAETRMIHSAIQTVVSEVYASDEWEEYGKNNGTGSVGPEKYYIAQKEGEGVKRERYQEIVRLAEVKGKFYACVTKDGKVMVIIYEDGKGQVGIYFGETQEYVAYDKSEFASSEIFPNIFQEIVFYVNANQGDQECTPFVSKSIILNTLGYKGADIPEPPERLAP